jgi:hypothetical protein
MIVGRQMDEDHGRLWSNTRRRIVDLLSGRSPDELGRPVPAAGGHTVYEVVALVVDAGVDALAGNVHGTLEPGPGWCERAALDPAAVLRQWDAQVGDVAALVRAEPGADRLLVDLVTHEHDLRTALDRPGARDDDAVVLAVELLARELNDRLRAAGAPALRITCEQWGHETAPPPYYAILVADRFELFRALTGRRSAAEVRRWMWSDDPVPYLPYLAVHGALRDTDLDEPDPTIPPEYAERLRRQNWREPVTP